MVIELDQGRNALEEHIERGTPLDKLLVTGRVLESTFHDSDGPLNDEGRRDHMHLYRKVLRTYDPDRDVVLLSQEGSRRLIDELDEPDREFSKNELYAEARRMWWKVREVDSKLF
tara:strand:+ start:111 stop:455 length:345 start_codon:yes stop_codon:yes gene_type:complete